MLRPTEKDNSCGYVPRPAGLRDACIALSMCLSVLLAPRVDAQQAEPADAAPPPIRWESGPRAVAIGAGARLDIPRGYRWAGPGDARRLLEDLGNPDPDPEGVVIPEAREPLFLVAFRMTAEGYIPDDEKDRLDPAGLLKVIRDATERDNMVRRGSGRPTIDDLAWEKQPFYEPRTHNLTWAVRFKTSGRPEMNYDTRILGRDGSMQVKLIAIPDQVATIVPALDTLLDGFSFDSGKKYEDYVIGDRKAGYGLAAVIAGTSAAFAARSGWLGRPNAPAGRVAPNGPSLVPHPASSPFLRPLPFAIPGASASGTRFRGPNPLGDLESPTLRPAPGVGVPLGILPEPAYGGRPFPRSATGVYQVPTSLRPDPTGIPAAGKDGRGLVKGFFAAIGAAILGVFAWVKKQFGSNRSDTSEPA